LNYDNDVKNMIREIIIKQMSNKIRNGIFLPSSECLDIKYCIKNELTDEESNFICYEKEPDIVPKVQDTLNKLKVNYEIYPFSKGFEQKNLTEVLLNRKSNFIFLDSCTMLHKHTYDWCKLNINYFGQLLFEKESLFAFNFILKARGCKPYYEPDYNFSPSFIMPHISRGYTPPNELEVRDAVSTMSTFIPFEIDKSLQISYRSQNGRYNMVTGVFMTK